MRHVQVSMHDVVGARLWKESLYPLLHAAVAHDGGIVLRRFGREHRSPQAGRPVGRDLEAIAPRAGLGEIAAIGIAALPLEIERRREDDEPLRPGEPVEGDFAALSHGAATAVCTDEIGARVALYRSWSADIDADGSAGLSDIDDFVIEKHFDVRKPLYPLQQKIRGLELLALNNKGMSSIPREDRMIELGHESIGRPVPELKDRRDQSHPRHILVQAVFGQQI